MEFFKKYILRMDEADGGEGIDAGGGAADAGTTATADPYKAEIETLRSTVGETTKRYNDILTKYNGLEPQLEVINRMKSVFAPEEKKAPFADGINHANVTEAAELALKEGNLTREEMVALKNDIAGLKAINEGHQYNQAALEMNEYWLDRFDTQKDFENALNMVGKVRPDLEQKLAEFTAGGKTPNVQFLQTVDAVLNKIVLEQMFDTNSQIAKSVSAKLARKAALQNSSVMDGDGYTDHAKGGSSSHIQISYE